MALHVRHLVPCSTTRSEDKFKLHKTHSKILTKKLWSNLKPHKEKGNSIVKASDLEEGSSSAVSSISWDDSDKGVAILSLSGPFAKLVLIAKLASKLPKLNPVLSASGTWRWFGIITFRLSEKCSSSSFFCSFEVASSAAVTVNDWVLVPITIGGTSDVLTVEDGWLALGFVGFGFHSLLGTTAVRKWTP